MHEAGTPNGLGAVTMACSHEILFREIEKNVWLHNQKLLNAIKEVGNMLMKEGYEVSFIMKK